MQHQPQGGSKSAITDSDVLAKKEVFEDKLNKERYMPSTTTTRKDGIFLVYNTHAYSECGTYDDDTTYVKCSLCNQIVMDEYDCLTEEEIEVHKLGLCMAGVAMRYTAYWLGEMHRRIYKPCEYCHNEPCDCPF